MKTIFLPKTLLLIVFGIFSMGNLRGQQLINEIKLDDNLSDVVGIQAFPNNWFFATAHKNGEILIWDIYEKKAIKRIDTGKPIKSIRINAVESSPKLLIVHDESFALYDVKSREMINSIPHNLEETSYENIYFQRYNIFRLVLTSSQYLREYDLNKNELTSRIFEGHQPRYWSSQDIVISEEENTIHLSTRISQSPFYSIKVNQQLHGITYSTDAKILMVLDGSTAFIHDFNLKKEIGNIKVTEGITGTSVMEANKFLLHAGNKFYLYDPKSNSSTTFSLNHAVDRVCSMPGEPIFVTLEGKNVRVYRTSEN